MNNGRTIDHFKQGYAHSHMIKETQSTASTTNAPAPIMMSPVSPIPPVYIHRRKGEGGGKKGERKRKRELVKKGKKEREKRREI